MTVKALTCKQQPILEHEQLQSQRIIPALILQERRIKNNALLGFLSESSADPDAAQASGHNDINEKCNKKI